MQQNVSLHGAAPYVQLQQQQHHQHQHQPSRSNDSILMCNSGICSPGNFSLLSINSGSGVMANISGGTYLLNTQPTNLLIINASDIPLSTENYSKFESALTPAGDIIVAVYLVLLGKLVRISWFCYLPRIFP